jgi:hypothetical protein
MIHLSATLAGRRSAARGQSADVAYNCRRFIWQRVAGMAIMGGCLCGAARYSIAAEAPLAVRLCWCRVCQYFATGNATVNAIFKSEEVTIAGELRDFSSVADSGARMHRRFCATCGVHVISQAEARPHLTIVRVGTLDDPDIAVPQGHIWTKSAPSWACFDPKLPQAEGQP